MSPAPDTQLTPQQIKQFKRDGFLSIGRLVDDQTLAALRAEYDRLISGEIESGEDNRLLGGLIHQVMHPSRHSAFMRDNPAIRAAKEIAVQLTGAPSVSHIKVNFDMLIDKPAGTEKATPWHQDFAYSNRPMTAAGTPIPKIAPMQFWVALDDVDLDNSCMQFAPGVHVGPLMAHHIVSGDPGDESRMLAIKQIDSSKAVACPLLAGGCTVHHYGTPHYTGPNRTQNRNRRAYIFNLSWPRRVTLFSRIAQKPVSWFLATTFLWMPFLILCYLCAEQFLFRRPADPKSIMNLALWSYPSACAISAGFLFLFSTEKIRLAIIPNLAVIPLSGLALYLYNEFFRGY